MLELKNITKIYEEKKLFGKKNKIIILDNISFALEENFILGVTGESGSGKSTLGKIISGAEVATQGEVIYKGEILYGINKKTTRDIQIIFQNPYLSLDPKVKVGKLLIKSILKNISCTKEEAREKVIKIFKDCGLNEDDINKYPTEFSGGQRQRIVIARALLLNPKVIICDEITSALDMVTQIQILNLLIKLKKRYNISYIFITHNRDLLKKFCDDVLEIKNGKLIKFVEDK